MLMWMDEGEPLVPTTVSKRLTFLPDLPGPSPLGILYTQLGSGSAEPWYYHLAFQTPVCSNALVF